MSKQIINDTLTSYMDKYKQKKPQDTGIDIIDIDDILEAQQVDQDNFMFNSLSAIENGQDELPVLNDNDSFDQDDEFEFEKYEVPAPDVSIGLRYQKGAIYITGSDFDLYVNGSKFIFKDGLLMGSGMTDGDLIDLGYDSSSVDIKNKKNTLKQQDRLRKNSQC